MDNEVFISYSRRDKVFTQKLYEALKAANRIVWADWDSIPAASDWDAEIKEGIEQTQTVLFVLSPEWLKSNECRKELNHAVAMGKRLFPILYLPVNPSDVPPELAKINWVYMRDTDDFDKAFQVLCTAMDTDLDWVKGHTRLQVRAVEWDKKKRENSFTLQGKDLADAEQFLAGASGKEPQPTALQGEYILSSRKNTSRRQRNILIGVITALVVSVILGIVALFQRQAAVVAEATAVVERDHAVVAEKTAVAAEATAVAERDRADLNAKISFARELTAEGSNDLNKDPERSILLGLEAVNVLDDAGQPILTNTQDALRLAVQNSRIRYTLNASDPSAEIPTIEDVSFSPNGQYIASASDDHTARVWEIATGKEIARMSYQQNVYTVAFSPNGKYVASGSTDGNVDIWEAMTGKSLAHMHHDDVVWSVAFSPDGKRLVTASEDKTARVWDVNTGKEMFRIDHDDKVQGAIYSPDGKSIATIGYSTDERVQVWDAETGASRYDFTGGICNFAYQVQFSPDGKTIGVSGSCVYPEITLLNVDTPGEQNNSTKTVISPHAGTEVHDFVFSPDGTLLASGGEDFTVVVMDLRDKSTKFELNDTSAIYSLAFSPDGKYIVTGNDNGQIKIWSALTGGKGELGSLDIQRGEIDTLKFSPDGKWLATTTNNYAENEQIAILWPLDGGNPVPLFGHTDYVEDISFSSDGKKVVTASGDCTVRIWDVSTGEQLLKMEPPQAQDCGDFSISSASFSPNPDGKYVSAYVADESRSGKSTFAFWEASTGEQITNFPSSLGGLFSPDGSHVRWGNNISEFPSGNNPIAVGVDYYSSVEFDVSAFSPDGKQLLIGDKEGTVKLWDATTGSLVKTFSGHTSNITGLAFNPDGTKIVSTSDDRTAKLWDVASGALLTTFSPSAGPVKQVAFSPDGKILALGAQDGAVRFYFVEFDDLLKLANARITRSFTEEECQTYLHVAECPDGLPQPRPYSEASADLDISAPPAIEEPGTPLQADTSLRSSTEVTAEVKMTIINSSSVSLNVYWIDENGKEQSFGAVDPGNELPITAYVSMPWRAYDQAGNLWLEYVTTDQVNQTLEIGPDMKVTLK